MKKKLKLKKETVTAVLTNVKDAVGATGYFTCDTCGSCVNNTCYCGNGPTQQTGCGTCCSICC